MNVITLVDRQSYYHGIIPSGTIGKLAVEKIACVRLRKDCKCQYFSCVDFGDVRAAYHKHEYKRLSNDR